MELQRKRRIVRAAGPLDGGYGWFIVLSTFLVFGLTFGVIKSFGVFFVEIQHYFATTATASSWITSISVATVHFGAPVGSALSACFGHRPVVMVGGLLSSIGMVAGSYAQDLLQLYITVGFLTGFGYALTWTPTVTMLGWYFEKRRPVANALASTGECLLTFVLTPSFQFMVDQYSWRGAMLILGALQLNLCLCGALLRPLNRHVPSKEQLEEKDHELELLSQSHTDSHRSSKNGSDSKKSDPLKVKIISYVDYTLIANARFMVYSMFGVFAALGFFAPSLFLVPYARSQGVEEYQAAALMSISAVLDLFGRVLFGWVANLRLVKTVHQLIVTVILLGIVLLLCPLATTFTQLALFSAGYGLVFGATVAIHITVLAEVVGVERLGSALGFFMLIRSSGGLLGPPLAGIFIDRMNDYGAGFLMAGVALLVSALFLLVLHQMNKKEMEKGKDIHLENGKGCKGLKNRNSSFGRS
ncbi:monocarboxylate transporter 13 [Megalobrama amblycephala]|uniref:monocarboxylate transporter 13 n=1 Tax=Megalobrama amblycephala TaxID=75352 RepID=UPI0020142C81|nr:monocarboxylate transporter 13 [Megalobrama amblycephala]XP_048025171.1 monocarboxylate transporter 13 [Megalobrama amblycephala]XP_048025172.1 monocarboxylate transporter 13 [Megalobrama amblycephala]XP_048025173.1 monocarboxylate transporter 13 [Megalobrama amblycephala]